MDIEDKFDSWIEDINPMRFFMSILAILAAIWLVVSICRLLTVPIGTTDTTAKPNWTPLGESVYYREIETDGHICIVIGGAESVAVDCWTREER